MSISFKRRLDFLFQVLYNNKDIFAGVMELADVPDSKSGGSDTVRVRPPLPAPKRSVILIQSYASFSLLKTAEIKDFLKKISFRVEYIIGKNTVFITENTVVNSLLTFLKMKCTAFRN